MSSGTTGLLFWGSSLNKFQLSPHIITITQKTRPGTLYLREFADSVEESIVILKKGVTSATIISAGLPSTIKPCGLDAARQWYLYEHVRQFCQTNLAKDLTCPKPLVLKPRTGRKHNMTDSSKAGPSSKKRK